LINLNRVAKEIKYVGLYDLILQDVQKIAAKTKVSEDEIIEILQKNPEILEDYKKLNVEYNIGNIHLRDINLQNLNGECKDLAQKVNSNLKELRDIEKYTLPFEQSPTLVYIFSIEFFLIFSVQYLIVLLNLKEWQLLIYGAFLSSIIYAYFYAKRVKNRYDKYSKIFYKKYDETLNDIAKLESLNCIKKDDLWIMDSDEHI